jgi:hypothetical protein
MVLDIRCSHATFDSTARWLALPRPIKFTYNPTFKLLVLQPHVADPRCWFASFMQPIIGIQFPNHNRPGRATRSSNGFPLEAVDQLCWQAPERKNSMELLKDACPICHRCSISVEIEDDQPSLVCSSSKKHKPCEHMVVVAVSYRSIALRERYGAAVAEEIVHHLLWDELYNLPFEWLSRLVRYLGLHPDWVFAPTCPFMAVPLAGKSHDPCVVGWALFAPEPADFITQARRALRHLPRRKRAAS